MEAATGHQTSETEFPVNGNGTSMVPDTAPDVDLHKYDVLQKRLVFPDYYEVKRQYWVSSHAVERVYKNQNFMTVYVGPVGSGKTYSAIGTYEDIVGTENVRLENICFTAREFVGRLNSGELKKGDVLLFEEAGVSIARREWYTMQNKLVGYITQTFRRDNIIVIFTTPNLGFIDKNVTSLLHGYCEMIDPSMVGGKFGVAKYKHFKVKSATGDIYEEYPMVKRGGRMVKLRPMTSKGGNMLFKLPMDMGFLREYEMKKKLFVDGLKRRLEEMLDEKKNNIRMGLEEVTDYLMDDVRMYFGKVEDSDEDKKLSLPHLAATCYTKLSINYPEYSIRKGDVSSAISYLYDMGIVTGRMPGTRLNDIEDLLLIKRLMKEKHWNETLVAKHYNAKTDTIKAAIQRWKGKGIWR